MTEPKKPRKPFILPQLGAAAHARQATASTTAMSNKQVEEETPRLRALREFLRALDERIRAL